MAADIGVFVGPDDHGHGVPADVGVDLDLHVRVAGVFGLLFYGDGVDVFGVGAVGDFCTHVACFGDDGFDEVMGSVRTFFFDDCFYCVDPFLGFLGVIVYKIGNHWQLCHVCLLHLRSWPHRFVMRCLPGQAMLLA